MTGDPSSVTDLVSIGDLIVDFTCLGESDSGMMLYERNPGGAPMNAAAQVARLGGRAGAAACVGDDEHGEYLRGVIRDLGVDATNVLSSREFGTRFLFVYFRNGNDRWFSDHRGPRADLDIRAEDLDYSRIEQTRALLYSPLCNRYDRPIHEATRRAVEAAKGNGALLAFDPNFRFPYADEKLRRLDCESILEANVLKMTAGEFAYYLDETDVMRGSDRLLSGNARLVAVSMGADGSFVRNRRGHAVRPAFSVDTVDTTGAGDSFMGALLYQATRPGVDLDALTPDELGRMADFANACAAASTTRRGSLLVMPDHDEAELIMKNAPRLPAPPNLK